jgi:alpha-beta hydrolase superfamily lysophospholipase
MDTERRPGGRWTQRLGRVAVWATLTLIVAAITAFGGLVFGWTRVARTLPDLRGWHLDAPASEFRAEVVDEAEGYTFDDYLRQEDRIFSELDALAAGAWSGDSAGSFCRFTRGSLSHPAGLFERNWNRTFVLTAERPIGGVLLLHGLSDSPYSLRSLGERLHRDGYTVIGLRVPGHGTCPRALAEAAWEDWTAAVRVAMRGLRERVPAERPLLMVGYSNGGALTVEYAMEAAAVASDAAASSRMPEPDGLVLLSPMIGITPLAEFTSLFPLVARFSGEPKLAWSGVEPEIDPYKYSSWPTNASLQAHRFTRHIDARLAALAATGSLERFPPVLAVQSIVDSTVLAERTIDVLLSRLPVDRAELLLFDVRRDELLDGLINRGFEAIIRPRLDRKELPFSLTLVTQRSPQDAALIARTFARGSGETRVVDEVPLGAAWPEGVFSLSHVAIPIAPGDPVYGLGSESEPVKLPLGTLSIRGESGVLAISPSLLMRMRYNPFYEWTEGRIVGWMAKRGVR